MQEPLLKLLIVDDETRFLKTVSQRLELRGLEVATATNGPEAIALAQQKSFEVALLDLKMPGMDGSQLLQALKGIDPLLEAIILTGHGAAASAAQLSSLGAHSYLPKPYELEKLVAALAAAYAARLQHKHAARPDRLHEIAAAVEGIGCGEDPLLLLRELRRADVAEELSPPE